MPQYLLSVHMVEGQEAPSEEAVQATYAAVDIFNAKLQEQGAWVFGGGLHPADTATVVDATGSEVLTTDGPLRRGEGAARRLLDHRRPRPRRRPALGHGGQRRLPRPRRGAPLPGRA
jgi:hypothetical protein